MVHDEKRLVKGNIFISRRLWYDFLEIKLSVGGEEMADMYLENAGIAAARRAFFSYTMEPEGSYGIHVIFEKFLKDKKIEIPEGKYPLIITFLADYILLRIYVARYVLGRYAKDYTPLLELYKGFEKGEADFAGFMSEEAAPGRSVEMRFLPPDLENMYSEERMREQLSFFHERAKIYEGRDMTDDKRVKCIIDDCLSRIAAEDGVNLSMPSFWFFSREGILYARYLNEFYKGLIPSAYYDAVNLAPDAAEETVEAPGIHGVKYSTLALVFVALAAVVAFLVAR